MDFGQLAFMVGVLGGATIAMMLVMFFDVAMQEALGSAPAEASDFEEFYMDLLTYDEFSREEALGLYRLSLRVGEPKATIDL